MAGKIAARSPARLFHVRCAATKELKPLRKSLERKQKEILDATAALQSSTALDTPLALHGMVLHLQRLGCEAEALIYQAEEALALEEQHMEAERELPTLEGAAPSTTAFPSIAPAQPLSNGAEFAAAARKEKPEEGMTATEEPAFSPKVLDGLLAVAEPSAVPNLSAGTFDDSSLPTVASLLPETGRLWEEARGALGGSQQAFISVCQGKACCRAGSAVVLQELEGIAQAHAGLEVATTRCLDRCKQAPSLEVEGLGGSPQVCVSKDKPPKKDKKLRKIVAF
jgi:hypothetical protein